MKNYSLVAASVLVLMALSATAGYQYHGYQEKRESKAFFGGMDKSSDADTKKFFGVKANPEGVVPHTPPPL